MSLNSEKIPKIQRALVLQGGGALGAYEVGALKVLVEKLNAENQSSLFDIIAGTSIGAMNAAIMVSNIVNRNKTWKEAIEELENFWTDAEKGLSSNPDISKWWLNNGQIQNTSNASEESRRKYYSVKEFLIHGTPRVCTPPSFSGYDTKFGDQVNNIWPHHSSKPLEETIVKFSEDKNGGKKMRIITSMDKNQPRLLVVAVNVAKGKTVTFDSYRRKEDKNDDEPYDGDGITIDHVMASGSLPIFYDFRLLGGIQFCDGGLLSNTPFRELLQAHQDYWLKVIDGDNQKIPDLEVYIINVHPPHGNFINDNDLDGAKDRINDITYSDRNSKYDETITYQKSDYLEIIKGIKTIAKIHLKDKFDIFENDLKKFLETTTAASQLNVQNGKRTLKDLLNGSFNLTKVVRIENTSSYSDSISFKGADFSSKTIRELIEKGKKDALNAF